jgi:hypothetical protein
MRNELSDRQQAIRMRLAGETIATIYRVLRRSDAWIRKWWRRYLNAGGKGLYDLSRAHHAVVDRTPPHIERAVLSIRRRLIAHAMPQTRYAYIGAATIREELQSLGFTPIPTLRTIERILQRHNQSSPPLRLARRLPQAQNATQDRCRFSHRALIWLIDFFSSSHSVESRLCFLRSARMSRIFDREGDPYFSITSFVHGKNHK